MCLFELKADISGVIAFLSLIVSFASALFAWWSRCEAKKANSISLLSRRQEIFMAFVELKRHMQINADAADSAEVNKFYYHNQNSKIYFSKSIYSKLEAYYDACFWVANAYQHAKEPKQNYVDIYELEQRSSEIEDLLVKALQSYQ